ncbi:hypothetical protein EVAR_73479_1 [Eumeta japonica]|uniref:Uncharacterized protein n=1 Tax=Eumeta variegata TaxID=151549 RepID=A0A4C1SR29_EUMVA|nr:hypothetical protein EVAR_73479_1 [Eumeta japonica]
METILATEPIEIRIRYGAALAAKRLKMMGKWIDQRYKTYHQRIFITGKCGNGSHTGNYARGKLRNIDSQHEFLVDRPLEPDPRGTTLLHGCIKGERENGPDCLY